MKTRWKKIIFLLFILSAVILLIVIAAFPTDRNSLLKNQLDSWQVHTPSLQNYRIIERDSNIIKDSRVQDVTAIFENRTLQIKKLSLLTEDVANAYIQQKKAEIESVFEPSRSPYFQGLTTTIECPKEFRPIYNESINEKNNVSYYILYANERFDFGICSKESTIYKEIIGFTYCKNAKDVYQLKYFVPNEEFNQTDEETIRSFSC